MEPMDENQSKINDLIINIKALEMSLVQQMQIANDLRRQLIIKDNCLNDVNEQIQRLLEENKTVKEERDHLQKSMHCIASEAQAIEG